MMMQNIMSSVRDNIIMSDMCYMTICPACYRLVINCDCIRTNPKPDSIEVLMEYSIVMLDIYVTVASMADTSKPEMALPYISGT